MKKEIKMPAEEWVINVKKIKNVNSYWDGVIDKQYTLRQIFNTDLGRPTKEHLRLIVEKLYNELINQDFLEE